MSTEVLELTTRPEANLDAVWAKKSQEVMMVAAQSIREDSAWFTRAKLELITGPCAPLMTTAKGMTSFVKAMTDAGQVGLSFGGPKPQAYFVPKGGEVKMIPTAQGLLHATVYGIGGVLARVPELITVHEGDTIRVDPAAGMIEYNAAGYDPFAPDRGKVKGWVMKLEFKDGRHPVIRHIDAAKVREIESKYSQTDGPALKKSPDEMHEKTAVKWLLRDVFAESAGLAKMILEGDEAELAPSPPPVERDMTTRTSRAVDVAVKRLDPEKAREPEPEPDVVDMSDTPPGEDPDPQDEPTPETTDKLFD